MFSNAFEYQVFETFSLFLSLSFSVRASFQSETRPREKLCVRTVSSTDRLLVGVISGVYYPNDKHIGMLGLERANLWPRVHLILTVHQIVCYHCYNDPTR